MSKYKGQEIIRVWACCGVFGWAIPWPRFHIHGIYAHPPDDETSKWIYLYTKKGQADDETAARVAPTEEELTGKTKCMGTINLDDYLSPEVGIDWDGMLNEILEIGGGK